MSYQDKYIKYKTKYNNLKMHNFYELSGGENPMTIAEIYYSDFNTPRVSASKYKEIINKYNNKSKHLKNNKIFETGLSVGTNYINMKLIPLNNTKQEFVIINDDTNTFGYLHVTYTLPVLT